MAFLARDGKSVYYEHHRGPNRPVVLVHGWGATSECWDTTLTALLTAGHEVVLIDHRACGRSDRDFDDVSVAAIASDVVALVRELGLDRPVLDGWSFGGAVVVAAAAELGDAVSGVVLTGGATPRYSATDDWPHGGRPEDTEAVIAGLAADRAATFRAITAAVAAKPLSDDLNEAIWLQFMQTGAKAAFGLRDLVDVEQRELLASLAVPILSLHGTDDAFVPISGARAGIELARDGRLVEFPGCGHAPFLEDPATYQTELLRFLDQA
ncbi:alpha/beta fold hydrolase [Pseudonocardia sp. WMMC193]|uniref:alpha/beta fold hydrolase n=1 Tax=Pseudonocardia sp. WMMC193 TaxID=2911965 RepID=UPI001F2FB05F|nr:alpha/beta hydrolase [Pseudonocardia sp. WMMC193]MCF7548014.1 alpha/beta hydrolase [Pseudonocardia sp. WMMC193]